MSLDQLLERRSPSREQVRFEAQSSRWPKPAIQNEVTERRLKMSSQESSMGRRFAAGQMKVRPIL